MTFGRFAGEADYFANLAAYIARGEARPAFKRAFAAHLAVFTGKPLSAISTGTTSWKLKN